MELAGSEDTNTLENVLLLIYSKQDNCQQAQMLNTAWPAHRFPEDNPHGKPNYNQKIA